jgi:hypothetical protein
MPEVVPARTHLLPELIALDDYRLSREWSWAALSAHMEEAGVPMSPRTLHHICRRAHEDATVRDITILKIRKFLTKKKVRITPELLQKPRPAARVALRP